jgi:hypothetical protein
MAFYLPEWLDWKSMEPLAKATVSKVLVSAVHFAVEPQVR